MYATVEEVAAGLHRKTLQYIPGPSNVVPNKSPKKKNPKLEGRSRSKLSLRAKVPSIRHPEGPSTQHLRLRVRNTSGMVFVTRSLKSWALWFYHEAGVSLFCSKRHRQLCQGCSGGQPEEPCQAFHVAMTCMCRPEKSSHVPGWGSK